MCASNPCNHGGLALHLHKGPGELSLGEAAGEGYQESQA